jgi:hypothetical protein
MTARLAHAIAPHLPFRDRGYIVRMHAGMRSASPVSYFVPFLMRVS